MARQAYSETEGQCKTVVYWEEDGESKGLKIEETYHTFLIVQSAAQRKAFHRALFSPKRNKTIREAADCSYSKVTIPEACQEDCGEKWNFVQVEGVGLVLLAGGRRGLDDRILFGQLRSCSPCTQGHRNE